MNPLRLIAAVHGLVVVALAVSLFFNFKQAADSSARGQELYKIGLRDGELFTRNQILRAEFERQIVEDQQTQLSREKL